MLHNHVLLENPCQCDDMFPASMSTLCLFASLLEHFQCFLYKNVFLIFALSRNTVPKTIVSRECNTMNIDTVKNQYLPNNDVRMLKVVTESTESLVIV